MGEFRGIGRAFFGHFPALQQRFGQDLVHPSWSSSIRPQMIRVLPWMGLARLLLGSNPRKNGVNQTGSAPSLKVHFPSEDFVLFWDKQGGKRVEV